MYIFPNRGCSFQKKNYHISFDNQMTISHISHRPFGYQLPAKKPPFKKPVLNCIPFGAVKLMLLPYHVIRKGIWVPIFLSAILARRRVTDLISKRTIKIPALRITFAEELSIQYRHPNSHSSFVSPTEKHLCIGISCIGKLVRPLRSHV